MKKKLLILIVISTVFLCSCGKEEIKEPETEPVISEESEQTDVDSFTDIQNNLSDYITDEDISFEELISSTHIGDYSKISIDKEPEEVTDEDVENEIQNYLSYASTYEHITDGTVEDGDTINIYFVGTMDGKEFDGGSGEFDLTIGSGQFIPGFEDGLIGAEIGSTTTLHLTFPKDYEESLAGKNVDFEVTINYKNGEEIKAELTDEFVKTAYGYESVEEMRSFVKESLETNRRNQYEYELNDLVYRRLEGESKIPAIPMPYIDEYVNDAKLYYLDYAKENGLSEDNYIEELTGVTEEEFDKQLQTYAVEYYRKELLIMSLAKDMGLEVSDADYEAHLEDQAAEYSYESKEQLREELEKNGMVDKFKDEILRNKVMEKLKENIV